MWTQASRLIGGVEKKAAEIQRKVWETEEIERMGMRWMSERERGREENE